MKISKNCLKGRLIKNPFEIIDLAINKKSIFTINWGIKPAAFYLNLQFRIVMDLIKKEKLYFVINIKN